MRYPGGNFASGYHWQDGVGPREERPTVRELAWQSIEPNQFGTDEYHPALPQDGLDADAHRQPGHGHARRRRATGSSTATARPGRAMPTCAPRTAAPSRTRVKLWCLGNEMDGPWQFGHVPADQYAIRAQQAAKMMKDVDRSIELVACGSCGIGMPTYMEWDRQVLEYLGDLADYVSLHRYVGNREDDTPDYLAVTNSIDRQIEEMDAACRFVQAKRRSKKRAYLCFDEWNVWYKDRQGNGEGKFAPHLIEEVYNLEDALVVAGFLNSFHPPRRRRQDRQHRPDRQRHRPAPDPGRRTARPVHLLPLRDVLEAARGGRPCRPPWTVRAMSGKTNGQVNVIDTSAILGDGALHVFAVNRSLDEAAPLSIELVDGEITALESAEVLYGTDPKAVNTFEQPDLVQPQSLEGVRVAEGRAEVGTAAAVCGGDDLFDPNKLVIRPDGSQSKPVRLSVEVEVDMRKHTLFDADWKFIKDDVSAPMAGILTTPTGAPSTCRTTGASRVRSARTTPAAAGAAPCPAGSAGTASGLPCPSQDKGKRVTVEFDGVYKNCEVWINGQPLGFHPYGYTSFHYDLTPYLHYGRVPRYPENVLAVRVDNSQQPDARWYTGAGIYRHVWLTVTDPLHVAHWGTYVRTPLVTADVARVEVLTQVQNEAAIAPQTVRW